MTAMTEITQSLSVTQARALRAIAALRRDEFTTVAVTDTLRTLYPNAHVNPAHVSACMGRLARKGRLVKVRTEGVHPGGVRVVWSLA